jgi:hypothetical protein
LGEKLMATFMDMINQGLGGLNTPLGQLGTQLLANSGPQSGNPSGGARMGQALAGMSEMQRAQALQQYRNQQIQLGEQQQQMALQQARVKFEQQQRLQQAAQDPNFLASLTPMARQMMQLGADPSDLIRAQNADNLASHRQATLAQSQNQFDMRQAHVGAGGGDGQPPEPKVPTPRQILELPLGDGWMQKQLFDPATNSYKPYGQKYRQYAPGRADPMQDLLSGLALDDNTDTGAAVPGLPGSNASTMQAPPQGAELLMRGSGSNPTARKPASPPAAPTGDLAAAKSAIAAGKSRQAVVARLTQAGYTPAQIQAAGI